MAKKKKPTHNNPRSALGPHFQSKNPAPCQRAHGPARGHREGLGGLLAGQSARWGSSHQAGRGGSWGHAHCPQALPGKGQMSNYMVMGAGWAEGHWGWRSETRKERERAQQRRAKSQLNQTASVSVRMQDKQATSQTERGGAGKGI